ncbi:hypothetical protein ACOKFD_12995 [Flagellimonas sp. S174]|uniref:hypothetical protein n=1 Tax=Flagellimonas sp. S174 TaxID=3410790 RepID=UPI003BF61236
MDKKTRNLLIGIGILAMIAGIYGFATSMDSWTNYFGIFIGLSIIFVVYTDRIGLHKNDENEK